MSEIDVPRHLYEASQTELVRLRKELAKANEKIDQAWNRSHAMDHKTFIPGALDAWKRPVPQHLPYDFSGNPGASVTQYCNGWNDSGGYWSGHASDLQQRLTAAEQRNAELEIEVDRLNRVKMALLERVEVHSDNCSVYRVQLTERDALINLGLTMINRGIVSFDDQLDYRQKLSVLKPTTEGAGDE